MECFEREARWCGHSVRCNFEFTGRLWFGVGLWYRTVPRHGRLDRSIRQYLYTTDARNSLKKATHHHCCAADNDDPFFSSSLDDHDDDPFFFSDSININDAKNKQTQLGNPRKNTHTIRLPRKPAPSIYVGDDTYIYIGLYKNGTIFFRLHLVRRKVTIRLDV